LIDIYYSLTGQYIVDQIKAHTAITKYNYSIIATTTAAAEASCLKINVMLVNYV